MSTAFVGRQPIFASNLEVFGYELLFRDGRQNQANVLDGDFATASVLSNCFTEVGLDVVVGSKRAFVNLTRNLLLNGDLSCLPPELMVLEVLEDIAPDRDVVTALQQLKSDGYTIALDDFIYCSDLEPLIALADIVKIEFPQIPREELKFHIDRLRELDVPTILAEKIETKEEFELCRQLGCDLFQGYFFCRPEVVDRPKLHNNLASLIQLVCKLQEPDISTEELEEVIQTDANLSYRVLRFINSANGATAREVESLRHATVMLGVRRLRSLASMMMLASMDDSKPRELTNTAMVRAKMCELLAENSGFERTDQYYTVGLLSVMDAMLDMPMSEVTKLLPLSSAMNEALISRSGQLGDTLSHVINFEMGCGDSSIDMVATYLDALRWTADFNEQSQLQESA